MKWQGWFEAEPFVVHLDAGGNVIVRLGDRVVRQAHLQVCTRPDEAGEGKLLVLAKGGRAPSDSPWSWVNERGRGQVLLLDEAAIACQLHRRLAEPPSSVPTRGRERHPQAAFWLRLAATQHAPCSVASLVALTGYSYPTVHEWMRRERATGHLMVEQRGRAFDLQPKPATLMAWWEGTARWWPRLRTTSWPRRHGPVEVVWARMRRRLPLVAVGRAGADSQWNEQRFHEGWAWATGGDHLAALGMLVQTHDSDAGVARSAWNDLASEARMVAAPQTSDHWPGTRVTLFSDDHPLLRLLWFSAGAVHPACKPADELWSRLQRLPGLLPGLPLLDAIASSDARVVERGQEALAALTKSWEVR